MGKKKWLKKSAATAFAVSLVVPMAANAATSYHTADNTGVSAKAEETVETGIYPKPQEEVLTSDEGMNLKGKVNVVIHGDQNQALEAKLDSLLEKEGIDYEKTDALKEDAANIFITSDADDCQICEGESAAWIDEQALKEEQGYVLKTSNDENEKGEVTIIGADEDGAYYGVVSLIQMMEHKTDAGFAEAEVVDYPTIKLRGYVEGFYGYPWSWDGRLKLMQDSSKYKANTYIYAPKDDPYHRAQWRELYPEDQLKELQKLAQEGKKDNMSFCWSVHPGDGFNYDTDDDYNALIRKFEQLYDAGVRQFGISYDDLGGTVSGQQHADLINRVNREFVQKKGDVKPLIVVGTRYCNAWGPDMQEYFKPFFGTLDDDIVVMWTGANTMSAVEKDIYEWPKEEVGVTDKNLASWWNYPVNDYCPGNIMMAPLENLSNDVDNLSGFFLNPMPQAEASKVAIFSGADYSWNVPQFEKMSSWERAVEELVPEAADAFKRFADNSSYIKNGFEFDESRYLVDDLDALTEALKTGEGVAEAAGTLKSDFQVMKEDCMALRNLNNEGLKEEIAQSVNGYEAVAEAGIAGMDAFIAAEQGDISGCLKNLQILQENLDKAETFTIASLDGDGSVENVVRVGEKRIKPLLKETNDQAQMVLLNKIKIQTPAKAIGQAEGTEVVFNMGNYSINNVQAVLADGEYAGFMIPEAKVISEVTVETTNADHLKLQYSLNGIEWNDAETSVEGNVLKATEHIKGAYVRVVNKTDEDVEANIAKFEIKPVYKAKNVRVSTDLGAYENYVIENAIDGDMSTKFYSYSGASEGSYVTVDLGTVIPLYDTKICFAENTKGPGHEFDAFYGTKMEISEDGVTWTQIGDSIADDDYVQETIDGQGTSTASFNAEGQLARYVRFTATETGSNWVQVYEIFYNESQDVSGESEVILVDGTFDSGDVRNLYDGNLSTAFEPKSVKENDSLTYAMTTLTNVENLVVVQDTANISNAAVSVKTVDGEWRGVGTLDQEVTEIPVNDNILDVKFTFDGQVVPKIYEVILAQSETKFEEVSTAVLQYAVELASTADTDGVVTAVKEKFDAALANAKDILAKVEAGDKSVTQTMVDNAWQELIKVMQYLSFKQGDKTDLEKVIALAETMETNIDAYMDEGKETFTSALNAARDVYADGDAMQDEVNTAWQNLLSAMANMMLKPDKGLLEGLVAQAEGLNAADYEAEGFAVMRTALANAKAVLADEKATQETVDASAAELEKAMAKLTPGESAQTAGKGETVANAAGSQNTTDKKDTTSADKTNTTSTKANTEKSAKTGDSTAVPAAGMTVLLSGCALALLARKRRKEM